MPHQFTQSRSECLTSEFKLLGGDAHNAARHFSEPEMALIREQLDREELARLRADANAVGERLRQLPRSLTHDLLVGRARVRPRTRH